MSLMPGESLAIVGIGASAGGLEALRQMFNASRAKTHLAFVVVQHLDPTHESLMAQLVERYTDMDVRQIVGGERVEPDHIYIIPPGHGLAIKDGVLSLTEFVDPRGLRRPIDDFFESLAEDRKTRAACVILSGTGADGSRGLRAVKEHGGLCVVQAPDSARYDGMPTAAIATGLVDYVREPGDIIDCLHGYYERIAERPYADEENSEVADHIEAICEALRNGVGHDFSGYKRSTLSRRIARRMQVLGIPNADDYLERLRSDPGESDALFRDVLINVTRFFRDSNEFEALKAEVVVPLVEAVGDGEEIRVWTPGCSSGEEAYSLAMMFLDAANQSGRSPYVQIFATDIDEKMLRIAREGVYPSASFNDIPPNLRARYLIGHADSFAIAPQVRDIVRFSLHSLIKDPPFSKIDLLSCRNLLIYFDEKLQQSVIPLFHFALRESGALFLGASEGIGRYEDLFETVDSRNRIFRRRNVASRYALQVSAPFEPRPVGMRERRRGDGGRFENFVTTAALRRIAEQFAPISLLVDRDGHLIDRWGSVGRYLNFPERDERRVHVPTLAKAGLREVIGALLREARKTSRRTMARDVEVQTDFGSQHVSVIIEPVAEDAYLFVIRETGVLNPFTENETAELDRTDGHVHFLEEELRNLRHRLRTIVEELETTNEELKSSNEEMMSMNEELQSTNEELSTVNDELKVKVDQLTVANADLKNFFASTELNVVVTDSDLCVRSITSAALGLFPLQTYDRGRSLADVPTLLADREFVRLARQAADSGQSGEARSATLDGQRHFMVRAIPYRRGDGAIAGASVIFTDITRALTLEDELGMERERLELALKVANVGVWEYEPSSDKTVLDVTQRALLGLSDSDPADSMEAIIHRIHAEDRDRVNRSLRRAIDGNLPFNEIFRFSMPDGGVRWLHGMGRRLEARGDRKFIGVTYDVTADRELLEQRDLLLREMNHRVKNLFAIISATIGLSARKATDVAGFAAEVRARIEALGRSHSLTLRSAGDATVSLRELLTMSLAAMRATQRIEMDGPEIEIAGALVTPLALIFHEWATNSAKYGAMGAEDGALGVQWRLDGAQAALTWDETASRITHFRQEGFGSNLIAAMARQLRGDVEGGQEPGRFWRKLTFTI